MPSWLPQPPKCWGGGTLPERPASADTGWWWVLGHVAHPFLPPSWTWSSQPHHALGSALPQCFHCCDQTKPLLQTAPPVCHAQGNHLLCPSMQPQQGPGLCVHQLSSSKAHQEHLSRQRLAWWLKQPNDAAETHLAFIRPAQGFNLADKDASKSKRTFS